MRGQFIVSVSLAPNQWPGALKDIQEEIDGFKVAPVSEEDLNKAKKTAIAQYVFGKETVTAVASSLASSYLMTGNPYYDEEYVDGIRGVTTEDIRAVARRYLRANRMNVAVTKPPAGEQTHAAAPYCPVPEKAPVEYAHMSNGLRTLVKQDSVLPIVTMQLYGKGGLFLEDLDHPGLANFTASLLTAGTQAHTKLDLLRKIEDAGGTIDVQSDNNTYHISIKVLKEDFDWALDMLADIARNAQFPQDEIEKNRQDTLVAIKRSDESWQSEVMRLFKKNYFKKTSYVNDRLGTVESVQAFSRDDILAFYHKMVNPTHSVLAVFGDIDPAIAAKRIKEDFSSWQGSPVEKAWPDETRQIADNRVAEIKNDKNSAGLFIGANGTDVNSADRPVLDVLTSVLSGGGSPAGRIFDALRGGDREPGLHCEHFPVLWEECGVFWSSHPNDNGEPGQGRKNRPGQFEAALR